MSLKNLLRTSLLALTLGLGLAGCQADGPQVSQKPSLPTPNRPSETGLNINNWDGVLVLSEGNMSDGEGVLAFIDKASGAITSDVVRQVNGKSLGNVAQDLCISKDKLYIVCQNGDKRGDLKHISIFDKSFKLLDTFTPDVIAANSEVSPTHLTVAHDLLYFVTNDGKLYSLPLNATGADRERATLITQVAKPLYARLFTVHEQGVEVVYVAGAQALYRIGKGGQVASLAYPEGYTSLGIAPCYDVANKSQAIWMIQAESKNKKTRLVKVQNLEEKGSYDLGEQLGLKGVWAGSCTLAAAPTTEGTMIFLRTGAAIYSFSEQSKELKNIYSTTEILYGYIGASARSKVIYLSQLPAYNRYKEAKVMEMAWDGTAQKSYPIKSEGQPDGLYTPFCALIYPISSSLY